MQYCYMFEKHNNFKAYLKFERRNQYDGNAYFVIREILVYHICRLRYIGELRIGGIE